MLKVLLVEDEVFARKGLLELIPWEELQLQVVGEANNGQEALAMMERLNPELVITDIRMPILDGLDLIRHVKEHTAFTPAFIIISGYNDFKYAQQALRYGVHDYILKPVDDGEMTLMLRKLSRQMQEKRMAAVSGDASGGSLVEALIETETDQESAARYAAALGLAEAPAIVYVLAEIYAEPEAKLPGIKAVQEVFHHPDGREADVPGMEQQPGKYGLLLSLPHRTEQEEELARELERLQRSMSRKLGTGVGLYAGGPVRRLSEIRRSYLEANEAARHKYAEEGGVILYARIKDKPLYVFDMNPELSNKLTMGVEEGSREAYIRTADEMFSLFRSQRFTPQAVTGTLSRCMTGIMAVIREMGGNDEEVRRLKQLAVRENDNWSLPLLKEHFMQGIEEAEGYIAQLRKEQSQGGIKSVKNYIDTHYAENISLKSIASVFYMNAVYLGRLFRKTYGVYFNDYLLELRVQEAKKLLRQTDLRMYEIADRVGFQNADYFVTQFEKLEHASPTEYRNRLINKE